MTSDRAFELPDGSTVVIDLDGASPSVVDELETWSLITDDPADAATVRDPSVWAGLLSAGPLIVATVQGMIGNAAWSAFPAAARWLAGRRENATVLDATAASSRAVSAAGQIAGVDASAITVTGSSPEPVDGWRVTGSMPDGRRLTAVLDAAGVCVSVVFDGP